ncbi:flagellar hook-associated protein FlgK [Kiloniella sp. b19]|uniref:flagellar hook-associated protein FlgK n=1 Tax=Kiloniella sp. GXU_MW_B19 TaxID=3141326 RepID=UPI0031D46BF0
MSITVAMNIALSGLRASQSALALTSNNLAGVNDPTYVRRQAVFQSEISAGINNGVSLADVRRDVDALLQEDYRAEVSRQKKLETTLEYQSRIETLYGSVANKNALGDLITRLRESIESLTTSPEVSANQFNTVSAADEVASRIRNMAQTVQDERKRADQQIGLLVADINEQLAIIGEINQQIPGLLAQNQDTSGLRDQRDAAIDKLAGYMDIQYFETSTGQINVSTTAGDNLVVNNIPGVLSFQETPLVNSLSAYPAQLSGITVSLNGASKDITTRISDGQLSSLIELRDVSLPSVGRQLDQLAHDMLLAVNQAHNRGSNTPLGKGSTLADDPVQSSSRRFPNTAAPITLNDNVDLVLFDANGNVVGTPGTITAGAYTADSLRNQINTYLGANGNAVFNSDNEIDIRLNSGLRLAFVDQGPAANNNDAGISFDADGDSINESYSGFSNFFGFNNLFESTDLTTNLPSAQNQGSEIGLAENFVIRSDLKGDPSNISRGRATGTNPNYSLGVGDNKIALQLAAVFDQNQTFDAIANGPGQVTSNFSGYASVMLSQQATTTASTSSALDFQRTLTNDIENRFRSQIGVNLDEELSNMVIFQNSYNAAARVIETTREMLDELLRIAS